MKTKFDYVISACNMMGIGTKHYYETPEKKTALLNALNEMMQIVNKSLSEKLTSIDSSVSVLFNAFTESDLYDKTRHMAAELVYADSGGLQIITAGREITEDLKDKVYEVQSKADRAMCFDIIPLDSTTPKELRGTTERSNTGNKIFRNQDHAEAGRLTGLNILRQCEIFAKNGSAAKVLVIVQGNQYQDMVL